MDLKVLVVVAFVMCSACPVRSRSVRSEELELVISSRVPHSLWKRFIETSSSFGGHGRDAVGKMRTRRSLDSEEQCEQLRLCKLHAHSSRSFFATFELYFVNKENARLWDHQARSAADCERRFSCDR